MCNCNSSCPVNCNCNSTCSASNTNSSNNTNNTLAASDNSSNCRCTKNMCMNDSLEDYIGRRCTCEFSLGNNLVRRTGVLSAVGNNYIRLVSTNNCSSSLICNTDNLTFVKFE